MKRNVKNGLTSIVHDETGSVRSTMWQQTRTAPRLWIQELEIPRKLFHMSSATIPLIYLFSGLSREIAIGLMIPVFILIAGSDLIRQLVPSFNRFYVKRFGILMRDGEENGFHNATYFMTATLFVSIFFSKEIAILSLLLLSFGDPAAAIFGRMFGELKIFGKTVEGSFACFQVCFLISIFFVAPWQAFLVSLIATLAELLPLPFNDNIRIPVLSAFALYLILL